MNQLSSYLYDIEMPPPAVPLYLWGLLILLVLLLVFVVLLQLYRQRQAEVLALKELQQLKSVNPYHLALVLREGLQEKQLKKVLPEALLSDLDEARYAPQPDVELNKVFVNAEALLKAKIAKLSAWDLLKRFYQQAKAFPVRKKTQPVSDYFSFVLEDAKRLMKQLWRRFHG